MKWSSIFKTYTLENIRFQMISGVAICIIYEIVTKIVTRETKKRETSS